MNQNLGKRGVEQEYMFSSKSFSILLDNYYSVNNFPICASNWSDDLLYISSCNPHFVPTKLIKLTELAKYKIQTS